MIKFRSFLLGLLALVTTSAHALPVEYRFTGQLTGDMLSVFAIHRFIDTPFTLSIFANTDTVSTAGYIAGAGRGFLNNSNTAIWSVSGLGSTTSANVQIYSIPGIARVGIGWDGEVLPLNTSNGARIILNFNGNEIATDPSYGRLSSIVAPMAVGLQTDLKNPPNGLPEYTTSIYFDGLGSLTLKNLSNINYSVLEVPEPSNFSLVVAGLGVLVVLAWRQRGVALG